MKSDNCYWTFGICGKPDVARHSHVSMAAIAPGDTRSNNHANSQRLQSNKFGTSSCDSNYLPISLTTQKVEIVGVFIAIGPSKNGKDHSS